MTNAQKARKEDLRECLLARIRENITKISDEQLTRVATLVLITDTEPPFENSDEAWSQIQIFSDLIDVSV